MTIDPITTGTTTRQGRWFLLAMLMALASALVPAVCASGLPATRLVGSAFDPTTSAVALRTRSQDVIVAKTQIGDRDETAVPAPALLPLAPQPISHSTSLSFGAQSVGTEGPRLSPRWRTGAQPRAPPAALG